MEFQDKVAVVTGAAQGIGKATCITLAKSGANIVAIDLLAEKIEETAKEVEALGRRAIAIPVDVSSGEAVMTAFSSIMKEFGKIDILVNAAGIDIPCPIVDTTEAIWDKTMDVNLKGVFLCSKAASQIMMEQNSGKIVHVSSVAGKLGEVTQGAYCCSKAGVSMLTQVMALELAQHNIMVNILLLRRPN